MGGALWGPLSSPDMKRLDGDLLLRVVMAAEDEATRAVATDAIFKAVWGGAGDRIARRPGGGA